MTKAISYWNSLKDTPGWLRGVYPMGGGGELEVLYRHFFETRHLFKIVRFKKNFRVLELGSGNGRWARAIAPHVQNYVGVDFSKDMIEFAKTDAQKYGINNVKFIYSSIENLKIHGKYDIIYFSSVSQYLKDKNLIRVINNLKTNLSSRGVIVDRSTINLKRHETVNSKGYFSIYRTAKDIERLYKSAGFLVSYQKRSYHFLRGYELYNRLLSKKRAINIVLSLAPFSFYFLYAVTIVADLISPKLFEDGKRSHDFFLLKAKNNVN